MRKIQPYIVASDHASLLSLTRGAFGQFLLCAACLGLLMCAVTGAVFGPVFAAISLVVMSFGGALAAALMRRGYPHNDLGLCNLVTLIRLALTSTLVAALGVPISGWIVLGIALCALALDGIDGWLARLGGHVSDFGARFDMEVDAALGLVLALLAWSSGSVGAVVLLLGLPRYVFVAASAIWPWMANPLPERLGRKIVCVIQIMALVILQAPVIDGSLASAILVTASSALIWSFGRDVLWLWRTHS
ncbi:MAG: CDP-alcohol phosphatidyltransferase family protein [Pelagibaca sp.]